MFLLLRILLIWNLIIWREVISAFKCFHSHISIVLQNIQKPPLQKIHTNNRRILWIDWTRTYRTMVALLLYTNEAGKRWQSDILSYRHNYLLPVTIPHIILNMQSEYSSALHDPNRSHRTPGSPTKTCKGLQLPHAQLLLSPQPNGSNSHLLITHLGVAISMYSSPQMLKLTARSMVARFCHSITVPHS